MEEALKVVEKMTKTIELVVDQIGMLKQKVEWQDKKITQMDSLIEDLLQLKKE